MFWINSKGTKWYLHSREVILPRNKVVGRSYFFRKEKTDDYISDLPSKYTVFETRTGVPFVKKL